MRLLKLELRNCCSNNFINTFIAFHVMPEITVAIKSNRVPHDRNKKCK